MHLKLRISKIYLDHTSEVGVDHEKQLVTHIKSFEKVSLAPDKTKY